MYLLHPTTIQIVFSCPSQAQCTYLCRLIQSRALSRDNAANGSLGNLLSLKSRDLSDEATFLKWKTWICTSIFLNHNNYRVLHMDIQVFMWNTLYESMYSYHGHLWILKMHIWIPTHICKLVQKISSVTNVSHNIENDVLDNKMKNNSIN